MADIKKNQSKVYNALKGMGYSGIGASEEEFAAKMGNPKNREKVYKALTSKGYKGIGKDQAAFDSLIYQAPAAQTQVAAPERPAAQQPQIAPQPEQSQASTPPNQPYKPSELDLMKYGATLGNAQYAADDATKGIDILSKAQKTASPFGTGAASIGNNKNIRKGKQTFDAEKGAFVDTYITSDGRQFRDAQQANNVQANIDYNNDIRRTDETLRSLGVDPEAIRNKDVNHLLGDAYAERDRIKKAMKNDKEGREARISQIMSGGYDPTPNEKLEQRDTYMAALRLLDRRIDALETARDNGGFWGGTWDVLTDPSSYSFGLTDLEDAKAMQKISKKIEEARAQGVKPQLSESEKALARNYMLNEQAQAMNAENDWYQMGKGFGQTLSFMKDFAVTGGGFAGIAKGGMALGAKAGTKAATKLLGDYMTKNLGTKVLAKSLIYGGKGLGLAAGAEVGGLALNYTAQSASAMADIMNKQMGHLTVGKDGILSFEDSKSLGESVLKSTLSRGGENASELVGLAFDAVPGILGRVIQKTKVGQFATKVANSKFWKGYEKGMNFLGISSVWGEGMEEEYNMARDVLIGESGWFKDPDDPNKPAFFDGEQQLKTWETVGITSMLLRVPSMIATGVQGANYYGNLYNLNMSDRQMRDVFGDYGKYEAVKAALDGADNRSLPGTLNNIMNNGGLSKEEKQAMFLYANDLVLLRGFNIANVVAAANGITEQPRVASYQENGDGKSFDELDDNGNVIEHHEFETSDEMKAALYEAQQKRFDRDLQSDIAAMKTRPNDQYFTFIVDYCAQTGTDIGLLEDAIGKPSLERTDVEQSAVEQFAKQLHNTVYDNTMVHEQQSAQDGTNLADAMGIDLNNLSPEQAQQVQEVDAAWNGAKNSREQLFARNEEIAQEVLSREQQGLSPQEVVSSLDSFNEVDRQIVIDYYNQKARYEGLLNRLSDKINEAAANERQRHTFKGTINGQADLSNVYTISDGTNEYFLVSGNITTDSQGKITGSDSGLVIGMDLDGSFVQIKDTDGYSVMPVQQTLDQWEEAERIRLQEQTTGVIAPNQTMNPQVQPTEGGNVGDEAGASTGTGAYESPAPAPVTPTQPVNPPSPAGAAEQPAVTIESVTDKDGIKRYENGIAVDDAIADMIASGDDVNEIADASIAEAQAVVDKINGKATKTRKDLVDRKKAQDTITYYNNIKARWAEVQQEKLPAESEENVNIQPEQPNVEEKPVSSQQNLTVEEQKQQRIAEAKAKYGELFDDDFTKANDVYELVSMWVGRKRNLAWDDVNGKRGLQKELGWTRKIGGDTKYIETLLAKNGEGMGVDEFAHMVWESPENDVNGEKRFSTEEIKEALLELLKSAQSKSDVVDYALNTRIAQAEAALQEQQKRAAEAETEQQAEIEPLTDEEIRAMEANLPFAKPVEGEDIPDSPIVQLEKAIAELQHQEGMPPIKLVDTDRMSEDEWYDIASNMYGGAFVSQEEIETVRNYVMEQGVFYDAETNTITVFSDGQTADIVKQKVETTKDIINGRSNEEESGELETDVVPGNESETPQGETAETPAAETRQDSESQGSPESVEDTYLQPRNAEEEQIIANVLAQLQQEIGEAVDEQNKARSELEKAMARESERATDMFGNDNALNQPGQLFDNSDMPIDQSVEGVERRTAAEREKLQEATNKLNQLQSLKERNSRIRGALDNYRRQTKIETEEQPTAYQPKWQYQFHYDKETGRAWITRDDVSGPIPVGDGRFRIEGNSLAELRAILENPKNNLGELLKEVEAQLHNAEVGEQIRNASTPTEAIEQAAQQFQQEQEEKAYGADNKLVSQDRYEELKKRMKQKLLGQANMGFDPEIMQIGAEMAMFHIEAGARKFADYATRMINDLGDAIRPYLQGFYEAARRMPGMEQLRKEMDSTEFVDNFDVLSYDKQNDNSVNVNKAENNEAENSVSLQQEASAEVERKAEDADKYRAFSQAVADDMLNAMKTGEKPYKSIKDIRAKAKNIGLEVDEDGRTDILLQELVEDGLVSAARQYVNTYMVNEMLAGRKADEIRNSRALFEDIVKLYNLQPSITQRSSNRIKMQQYSTPLPMSFIADVFAFREGMQDVLEPTAGNGMMVFAVPEFTVHANELDDTRLDNLRAQKFKKVTDQDATQPFEGEQYDAIIANPPFGAAPAKEYDGKEISGLAEQIALNALSKMKDDGKAAIIIGGNMEYGPNGAIKSDKAFFTYLYDHYNVKGVIDMDGKLYSKQGTTFPTRMILIDGRRSEEERAQSKVYPPTLEKSAGYKVETFDELYDLAEEIKNNNRKTDGNEILRTSTGIALPDTGDTSGNTDRAGRGEQSRQNEPNGRRTERGGSNGGSQTATNRQTQGTRGRHVVGVQQPGIPGLFDSQETASEPQPQTGGSREGGSISDNGRNGSADVQGSGTANSGVGLNTPENPKETPKQNIEQAPAEPQKPKVEEKRELDTDKLSYRPHNTAYSLESVAPAAMVEAMDKMLTKIEKEHGNIDAFVTRELGYDSIEDMHNALAAEQVDSVAMAIYQMKHGQGMIIGDQTGVGKGRQMAALIRWACRQGKKPVFITQKADLFSDIYRDLVDIGSGELRPFIFNSDGAMVDNNGVVVHKPLSASTQAKVFAGHELPAGYDFAVLTYSQVNTGDQISQDEAKEAAKKSGERFQKKKKKDDKPKATPKASFLRALAKDNYMFLDESHTAAGKSNTGFYFQSILKTAKAVTFASATFAKRPDTMPMYALRTAMSKAKVKAEELIKIIENGGVTLQEIMSRALTQAGQMVRRERDMSDVKTDWKTVDDPETVKKARQNYDSTIEAFNAIIDFQKNWVSSYLDRLSHDLADVAASAGMRQGTEDLGISNVPFASKTYNYTKQLMLALKVDAIVDEVVKEIEAGRHPVIALENTMGSLLSEYSPGDVIEDTTFAASLLKGLKGVLRYTIKDEDGKEQQAELKPEQLGPEGEAAYHAVEDLIRESTSGIFISPLDAIIQKLQAKGYKVGELTGRNEMAVLDEKTGEYKVQRRTDKDKKKLARDFNSGALDVLILNKSASTGISLHASEKFSDQRQRTMIIAQPLADINDYMQMIGRIDRTGQVARGYYINLGLPVPAEGRFLMMLSTKLKSLNANTTTSQESESNDVEAPDLLNKYGSQVVVEYLRDNPDVYIKMGEPLKKDKARVSAAELDSYTPSEDDARKITGYVALLPTKEQDAFYNDVVRRYTELIKYLNDTGSNDLKISVLPLRARTIEKQISSEGADPTGDNPFAGNAYVEWVEMDVLKKPMKAAEVGKVIDQLNPEVSSENAPEVHAKTRSQEKMLNQRMTPRVRQILDIVEKEYQAKMDKEDVRYAEAKAKAEEAIKEQTEKINNSKRTPEQKKEAIEKYKGDRMQAVEETHNNMVNKIEASRERIEKPLRDFEVGDSYLVPDDLTTDTFFGASPAIFCGFKAKDDGITPSTSLAVFCTLDGRRKIEVKLSDWGALARIKNHTEQNWDAAHEVTLSNWDSQVSNETRKKGFIMTGNILQAFADAGQDGRVPGQLVTYTDIDGNVHDGILMGQHWEPSQLKGSTVPIKNRMDEIKTLPNGDHITSADGNVVIERLYSIYTISVPKSKKVGGQYYEDRRLLNLVRGQDFYPNRGQLRADIEPENIEEVVNVLSDLGVQMKSDNQVQFDTVTEMGQAQANGTFNNSQNTLSNSDISTEYDNNSVPLKRRTLKSYTDEEGRYHKGLEEELRDLEQRQSGTRQSVAEGASSDNSRIRRIKAEIARREQEKERLRKEYNIAPNGDITLDDVARMFRDLNSNNIIGKLFDKVYQVLKDLGVTFRITDKLPGGANGESYAGRNVTFYDWDALVRSRSDQEKARTLLHELIHNITAHILYRLEDSSLGALTDAQRAAAEKLVKLYEAVKKANPKQKNGKPFYGNKSVHEMVAELANPKFRKALGRIRQNDNRSFWQKIKDVILEMIGFERTNGTALGDVIQAFDDILDTYDTNAKEEYRQQRRDTELYVRLAEGWQGTIEDYTEANLGGGNASIVEDENEIARLNSEPTEKGYRTVVQNTDGTFGSPMASRLGGKKGESSKPTSPYKMNQWERSEENPQLASDNGKINLIKPGGLGTVGNVDYNPYIHIRENKLNKQFKNAWERPDLVYIEVEYPQSEMTSGYRAEKAAKAVGKHKWPGGDLILSRWDKPVRIVPWEEVADDWEREFGKRGVEFDIVSPHLLPILAERGVKILPPHKNMGDACEKAYQSFMARQEADPMNAIRGSYRQYRRQQAEEVDPMAAIERAGRMFRKQQLRDTSAGPLTYSAKEVYNERLNRVETVFSEAYQDAMVSLKTAQNAIAGDKDIPDSQNAYMAENLMHGKIKNEQDLYNREYRDPLIATINKILNLTGMNWGDIDRYVFTKSGLERNRVLFVRDWLAAERNKTIRSYEDLNDEEQDIYDRMADAIETMFEDGDIESEEERDKKLAKALQQAHQKYVDDMETDWHRVKEGAYQQLKDGNITFPAYLYGLDSFIADNIDGLYKPEEHDYSGFRAMYGDESGEYDEADIIDELMNTEEAINDDNFGNERTTDTLWEQINAATQYSLERYRNAGMRSDEDIDRVESMFHFYVPMRGFKAATGEDMYQYFTGKDKSKSYVGGLLKHAKGRGSEAEYPISTIFALSYKAIADCNQNLVNKKFYRLCQANPNDLVVLSDSWAVYDEVEEEWKESVPDIPNDASEEEVREITLAWEEQMRQLAKEKKAKKIKGKAEFDYKPMDKKNQSEHIVDVRINGQPRKMIVTSNPRMAQALNGQLRFEHGKNVFSSWNAAIKNMMATFFTSYSPTFALRNMFRDWTHFRTMLGVREGHGYAAQANKYYRQSLFKMIGLFKKYRNGTLDESKEMERDFKDFMDNGGITGFVFMQKIDDIQKEMENIYKKQKAGKPIRLNNNLWEKVLGAVEALNEGIENNARFATYRASRHYAGRTKARSAYDAKEITVNFNRKGAGGKTAGFKSQSKMVEDAAKAFGVTSQILGEGRIFFNATVQAIATTFKNFQNADGSLNKPYIAKWAAKYALPPFMFGLLLPAINKALANAFGGDDDDPYANLPEWTRRRNLCFYIGNDNFITIPVGQELAAFLALGDIVAGNTYSPDLKPVDRNVGDEMIDVMNTFSPVDISTKITKGGLMEDPISEVTGRTFSVLAPLVAIEQNLGWTGRPIYREDKFQNDQYTPEYQMVYQSTNPVLTNAMKQLHEWGGGDDITRGKLEVNPAIIQYLWEQYTGGPGKVFSNTISIGKDAKDILTGNESDFNIRKVEGLKAFVSQGDDRTQYYRTQAKYRKYKDNAEKLYNDVKGYESGAAENPEYLLKLENISKGEDFVRMQIIREADKQLSQINKAANKAEGKEKKELRRLYNEQVKAVVDMLDEVGKE